jgi:hypothetical protein
MDERRSEALIAEYGEVCNNFRMLTDIRFKLLAFLPFASAAAIVAAMVVAINRDVPEGIGITIGFALSLFGFVTTIGIATYNARNDQLYDELVRRAAAIERELNIPDGAFANRPAIWQRISVPATKWKIAEWKIDHRPAVGTIYGASIALWLFGAIAFGLEGCYISLVARFPSVAAEGASSWILALAVTLTIIVTYLGSRRIRDQSEERQEELEKLARDAMKTAEKLAEGATDRREFIRDCAAHQDFRKKCIKLAICTNLLGNVKDSEEIEARVNARADFYDDRDARRLDFYVTRESAELSASQLIGLLTDLSPLWIYDCGKDRKGAIAERERKKAVRRSARR